MPSLFAIYCHIQSQFEMPCLVGAIILLTYAIATSKYDTAAAVVAEPSNSFLLPPFLLATRSPAQGLSIDYLAAPAARLQGHDVEGRIQRVRGGFIGCEEEALGVRELLTREKRRLEGELSSRLLVRMLERMEDQARACVRGTVAWFLKAASCISRPGLLTIILISDRPFQGASTALKLDK